MKTLGQNIQEKFLTEIWKDQRFKEKIIAPNGEKIKIIDVGQENKDLGGPDFKNAKIMIGNLVYTGDVEIDKNQSDWNKHGHYLNNSYNNVILHAALNKDTKRPIVYTNGGRKVFSIDFGTLLNRSLKHEIKKIIPKEEQERTSRFHCSKLSHLITDDYKAKYISEFGIERFKKKSQKFVDRIKELVYLNSLQVSEPVVAYDIPQETYESTLSYDDICNTDIWEQILYEYTFEALGYTQNKYIMYDLAKAVPLSLFKSFGFEDVSAELLESIYFHVGGLIPEHERMHQKMDAKYLRHLYENWMEVKHHYDGEYFTEKNWNYFKLRPFNFPTIRIAAGSRLVRKILYNDLFLKLSNYFVEIDNPFTIRNAVRSEFIVKSEGYWEEHYTFGKKAQNTIRYFSGKTRADEIFINVILPFMYVYFDIFGREAAAKKVLQVYTSVKVDTENNLVKDLSKALKMEKQSKQLVVYQGMIELFRAFCVKKQCKKCEIGKRVFVYEN